jgi:DNA-binding SARP family transcriptional activator
MRYGVLGPLEVSDGERSIDIAGSKQRALLAMLLLMERRNVATGGGLLVPAEYLIVVARKHS